MRRIGVLLLAVSLFVSGCGQTQDRVAGGGSDQPNKIEATGRILTDSGAPSSGAKVVSYAGEWNPVFSIAGGKAYDSSQSDDNGGWTLRVPENGLWYVTASKPGYRSVSLPGQSEMRLSAEAQVSGTLIRPKGLVIESVWIGGTDQPLPLRCYNDTFCTFSRTTIPGPARIWAKVSWKRGSDTLLLAERIFESGFNPGLDLLPDTGNVLLASSDASPIRSALRGLEYDPFDLESGMWFKKSDTSLGGNSGLDPENFPDSLGAIKSGPSGRYFSWRMRLGDPLMISSGKVIYPWVGIGLHLSRRDLDWSGIKSLRLRVKGGYPGSKVWVQLGSSELDPITGNGQFSYLLDLPNGWSTIDIPMTAFMPPASSKSDSLKYSWDKVKHSIRDVAFYAASPNVTLDLQEIRAIGNRRQNW
jgi:hypothetical protein